MSADADEEGDWVLSKSLRVGDLLKSRTGAWKPILSIEKVAETQATFNFEVQQNHDYFVGQNGWLVHNQSLTTRAGEIHNLLDPIAQGRRTTAVLEGVDSTGNGIRIVGSSQNRLAPIQRSALRAGEIEAIGAGHAEITTINTANRLGITPLRMSVSRPICSFCRPVIVENNIVPLTPFK